MSGAAAVIVNDPPSSILYSTKNRFGLCNAFASTPPVNTFPELGTTAL